MILNSEYQQMQFFLGLCPTITMRGVHRNTLRAELVIKARWELAHERDLKSKYAQAA